MSQVHTLKRGKTIAQADMPTVVILETAELKCGCRVHVGRRLDNDEAATAAVACSQGHGAMMDDFNVRFLGSLEHPSSEPVVFVIDRILDAAEADWGSLE